jgi:hypothetical protein
MQKNQIIEETKDKKLKETNSAIKDRMMRLGGRLRFTSW